LMIKDWLLPR